MGVGVFFEDITEQKWQQEKLQQYTWTRQAISRAHHALLKPGDEPQLLQDICDAIAVDDRFPLVAVLQASPNSPNRRGSWRRQAVPMPRNKRCG